MESDNRASQFLSIQAQDFIEENSLVMGRQDYQWKFLSIQAQDFIEEDVLPADHLGHNIPEHSSSGLH